MTAVASPPAVGVPFARTPMAPDAARQRFRKLGYDNIELRAGDGTRVTLLTERRDDACKIPLADRRQGVRRGRSIAPHAHVERAVMAE